LLVLLIIFEFWIYYRVAIRHAKPHSRDWMGLFIGTFSLASTASHAMFPLAALGLYHLFFVPNSRRKFTVIGVVIAAGLPLIPWLPVLVRGSETISEAEVWVQGWLFIRMLFEQISNGTGILIPILLVLAAIRLRRASSTEQQFIWIVAIISTIAMFLLNERLPFIALTRSGRYFLVVYPAMLLIAALGLTMRKHSQYVAFVIIVVWLSSGIWYSQTRAFYDTSYRAPDFTAFAPLTKIVTQFHRYHLGTSQDFIITLSTHSSAYWERKQGEYFYGLLGMQGVVVHELMLNDIVAENRYVELGILNENHPTIWLAYDPQTIPESLIQGATTILEADYTPCPVSVATTEIHLQSYVRKPWDCNLTTIPDSQIATYVEQDIKLNAVQLVEVDTMVHLATAWTVQPSVPLHQYSASVQIFDASGAKVLQQDYGLEHSTTGYWHLLAWDTSEWQAETYTIKVIAYNWTNNEPLTWVNADGIHSTVVTVQEFVVSH
jgi:hypothetical protein